jgi:hypothetical protein
MKNALCKEMDFHQRYIYIYIYIIYIYIYIYQQSGETKCLWMSMIFYENR